MARKVFVSSDMGVDERLIEVADTDPQAALLWPWLLASFDDWGRAQANPRRLKAAVFPAIDAVTPEMIDTALRLFDREGLLLLYEVDGKTYMAIPEAKWYKYQTHIRRNKRPGKDKMESNHPAPPSGNPSGPCESHQPPRGPAGNTGEDNEPRGTPRFPVLSPSPSPSPSLSSPPTPPLPTGEDETPAASEDEPDPPQAMTMTPAQAWHKAFDQLLGPTAEAQLHAFVTDDGMAEDLVSAVIEECGLHEPRAAAPYVLRALTRTRDAGILTLADWSAQQRNGTEARARGHPDESSPHAEASRKDVLRLQRELTRQNAGDGPARPDG